MHWVNAGFLLYAFAAPSSLTGVAFTFAHAGLALGLITCVVCTVANVAGSLLLLEVILACPTPPRMLSEVGAATLGPLGAALGLALQMLNFLLYLPVALLTTAEALQAALQPDGRTCTNYFIFAVALLCFGSTQVRELRRAALLAGASLVAALGVAALQLVVVSSAPQPAQPPVPAKWFGPPDGEGGSSSSIELALALTTCVWAYVPSLLVTELSHEMERPEDLRRSIVLSGVLNLVVFIGVGLPVAKAWGSQVEDPITISASWPSSAPAARALAGLLCFANFVGYCLDSVPLARWCQRRFDPDFGGGWDARSIFRYAKGNLPAWAWAVLASVFVGQPGGLFTMLAWATALTVPACTLAFPAACALSASRATKLAGFNGALLDAQDAGLAPAAMTCGDTPYARRGPSSARIELGSGFGADRAEVELSAAKRRMAMCVLGVGVLAFGVCLYGAIGKTVDATVRGPVVIGCVGWEIYHSNGTHFRGF